MAGAGSGSSATGRYLETLYSTGIRASELTGMNREDLDKRDRLVRIRGKGRKERVVPVGQKALEAIDKYQAAPERSSFRCHLHGPGGKSLDSPDRSAYFRKI